MNLDFESEADMVEKYRASLALQPVATALSRIRPLSMACRAVISLIAAIFGKIPIRIVVASCRSSSRGMGFERYVEYALDVPMYFVYRDGEYVDVSGQSFRDFLDGEVPAAWRTPTMMTGPII